MLGAEVAIGTGGRLDWDRRPYPHLDANPQGSIARRRRSPSSVRLSPWRHGVSTRGPMRTRPRVRTVRTREQVDRGEGERP